MFYEVLLNGTRQYCAGFDGEGALLAIVAAHASSDTSDGGHTPVVMHVKGVSKAEGVLLWPNILASHNDELTIRIAASAAPDAPIQRLPLSAGPDVVVPNSSYD